MKRGPVFEVFINRVARWQWHEKARNGEIVSVSQAYSTKYAAKRAARRKAEATPGATWAVRMH
jgi:uncharacterized protein YegP (UPF0339 family)